MSKTSQNDQDSLPIQNRQVVGNQLLTQLSQTQRPNAYAEDFGLPNNITQIPVNDFNFDYRSLQEPGQFMICFEPAA